MRYFLYYAKRKNKNQCFINIEFFNNRRSFNLIYLLIYMQSILRNKWQIYACVQKTEIQKNPTEMRGFSRGKNISEYTMPQ